MLWDIHVNNSEERIPMSNMASGVYGVDVQGDVQHDVDLHVDTHKVTSMDREHAIFPLPREGVKTTIVDYIRTTFQIRQVNYLKKVTADFSQIHFINNTAIMAWLVFHVMWYIPGYSKMMHTKARLSMEAMVTDVVERNLLPDKGF